MAENVVKLSLGGGGKQMSDFIKHVILKNFDNDIIANMGDASLIKTSNLCAFSTDSFVIKPDFFVGGDIGKLAVCGTVNDLAVSGAIPKYLSFSVIVAEGYPLDKLEQIIISAGKTAKEAGVMIVCGDTKVVEREALDGIVINTAGVGDIVKHLNDFTQINEGDKIIVTSDIARHGMSIMLSRGNLGFVGNIESDCACLNKMLSSAYDMDVKFMRDATRGGLAAVLNEVVESSGLGVEIEEELIPIREDVAEFAETLGFDPLSVANEGLAVIIASKEDAGKVLSTIKNNELGNNAAIIGTITSSKKVVLKTIIGGHRYVEMPPGELLPRIC